LGEQQFTFIIATSYTGPQKKWFCFTFSVWQQHTEKSAYGAKAEWKT
jgi:hypothetical protein